MMVGHHLTYMGRFDEAKEHLLMAERLQPNAATIIGNLWQLSMMTGDYDAAREYTIRLVQISEFDPAATLLFIDAMTDSTKRTQAIKYLLDPEETPLGVYFRSMDLALLGEYDLALDALEESLAHGDPYATHINKITIFDPLHDNPRFQALLRQVNLEP